MSEIIQSGAFDQSVIDLIAQMEYVPNTDTWYILTRWTSKVDFDLEQLQKYFSYIEHENEILEEKPTFIGIIPREYSGRSRIHARFIDSTVGRMVFEKFFKPGVTREFGINEATLEKKIKQSQPQPRYAKGMMDVSLNLKEWEESIRKSLMGVFGVTELDLTSHAQWAATNDADRPAGELPAPQE